jgi:hypothetical protein
VRRVATKSLPQVKKWVGYSLSICLESASIDEREKPARGTLARANNPMTDLIEELLHLTQQVGCSADLIVNCVGGAHEVDCC